MVAVTRKQRKVPVARSELQEAVHSVVTQVGGYWQPLAGTARLLEEIGEVTETLGEDGSNPESSRLEEELADLWIITTIIANQFGVYVEQPPNTDSAGPFSGDNRFRQIVNLLTSAGSIARAINHYDGPKKPRSFQNWIPLQVSIPNLLDSAAQLASCCGVDLAKAIHSKLGSIPTQDSNRFSPSCDPSTSVVLGDFQDVCQSTRCPFADSATLWGATDWNDSRSFRENISDIAPIFRSFCKAAAHEPLDGFVIRLGYGSSTRSLRTMARSFGRLLAILTQLDEVENSCLDGEILEAGWQFQFHGLRTFITVHSDLYPADHVRHARLGTFVFFQPEETFDRHGIGGQFQKSAARKSSIRQRFSHSEYPSELIDDRVEAKIYVLSSLQTDEPAYLDWWSSLATESTR